MAEAEIGAIRAAIDRDEAAVHEAVGRRGTPSGWLGPLLATYDAHRRILALAEDYSPELEHGDNGEWVFDEVLRALAGLYVEQHRREDCGNHCSCGAVVKTEDAFAEHLTQTGASDA